MVKIAHKDVSYDYRFDMPSVKWMKSILISNFCTSGHSMHGLAGIRNFIKRILEQFPDREAIN